MAEEREFACNHCGFAVSAWSDGNPYYRDETGRKRYAYHPDHVNLARCIGNDVPHLCLACGAETKVDSLKPRSTCRKCKSGPLIAVCALEGKPCPKCRQGIFEDNPGIRAIS